MGFILKKPTVKPEPVTQEQYEEPVQEEPMTRKIPVKERQVEQQPPTHEFTEEDIEALIDYHLGKVLELRILLHKNAQEN